MIPDFSDSDGKENVKLSVQSLKSFMSFEEPPRTIRFKDLTKENIGNYKIKIKLEDTRGGSTEETVEV